MFLRVHISYLDSNLCLGFEVELLHALRCYVAEEGGHDLLPGPQLLGLADAGRECVEGGVVLRQGTEHQMHVV